MTAMERGRETDAARRGARGAGAAAGSALLAELDTACRAHGARADLAAIMPALEADLDAVEQAVASLAADGAGGTPVFGARAHLLACPGKRLRPLCVALAAACGREGTDGRAGAVRALATAAELVHAATLLHDDVVDLADARRGTPAARVVFGNAASIFAGDWLLVEALERISASGCGGLLASMLDVIRAMLAAESLQLARRGAAGADATLAERVEAYVTIARGKTASLFRWALEAGAIAGGALDADAVAALGTFGYELGVAFQVVDDVLDVAGDPAETGKAALVDAREGKMTLPLVFAMEEAPAVGAALARGVASDDEARAIGRAIAGTQALVRSRAFATAGLERAVARLERVPDGAARRALEAMARTLAARRA
jgi:octaprenyl-diphosphate synthase